MSNQISRICSILAVATLAAPAMAVPANPTGATTKSATTNTVTAKSTTAKPAEAPQQYRTLRSLGLVNHEHDRPKKPVDPKNPTWQDYRDAAYNAAFVEHDPDKALKYNQAAFATLVKSIKASPNQTLSHTDQRHAVQLCVNTMSADGTAIVSPDLNKMSDAKELEALVEQQQQHFGVMQTAYNVLKTVSPSGAAKVAFELPKCTAVMAKTKNKLEKAQAEAKSDTKTE